MSNDPRIDRLHDLIDSANDGSLDEAGYAELDAMLRDDAEMQRAYLEYTRFDGALSWEFGLGRGGSASFTGPIVKAAQRSVLARIGAAPLLAVAAALVFAAAVVVAYVIGVGSTPVDKPTIAVGVVTETADVVWASEPMDAGSTVHRGTLAIDRGMVRMTLNSGVELTILAPATVDLRSDMNAQLSSGRVFASVPQRAVGYTVDAPGVNVVDLGTEFGVDARSDATEVHVFDGAVVVQTGSGEVTYEAGRAAAVVSGRVVDEPTPDIDRFTYRVIPDVRYAWFSFDESTSAVVTPAGEGLFDDPRPVVTVPPSRPPSMIEGFVDGAIQFDGRGQYLDTNEDGITGDKARTVAAWVRVPADAMPDDAYAFVAWGANQPNGSKWQVAWNKLEENGAVGALRCEVAGGYVVGTTDLRDGRWHHVAVVYPGGEEHWSGAIRLYVDGKLETLTGKQRVRIDTYGSDRGGSRVIIGGFLNGQTTLRGAIDELYIIEAALTDGQIARLMETNQLETARSEP